MCAKACGCTQQVTRREWKSGVQQTSASSGPPEVSVDAALLPLQGCGLSLMLLLLLLLLVFASRLLRCVSSCR
jgi:hypothetical protein